MPATKALLWVVVLALIVSSIVFTFMPNMRPGFVQAWIDQASGFTPAKTPNEALEKFRECMRSRNFKTAIKYLDGDYREQFNKAAEPATKLCVEIDALQQAVQTVGLNAPDGKFILEQMQPFPKDFEFSTPERPLKDDQYRVLSKLMPNDFPSDQIKTLGDKVAVSRITIKLTGSKADNPNKMNTGQVDRRILLSLVPGTMTDKIVWDGIVALKESGNDKEKGWKIYIPLFPDVPQKVDYLAQNYGNYTQALKNVKQGVKNDASTKSGFESDLSKELVAAK
jgi:hypothetical protein